MQTPMVGEFGHRGFEIQWTCEEDAAISGESRWTLHARLGDIIVRRHFPVPLSWDEADEEAKSIAPQLFRMAVLELLRRECLATRRERDLYETYLDRLG